MKPFYELSIAEAGCALRDGTVTSAALTEDALGRIAPIDGKLDSFITVTADRARADAKAAIKRHQEPSHRVASRRNATGRFRVAA